MFSATSNILEKAKLFSVSNVVSFSTKKTINFSEKFFNFSDFVSTEELKIFSGMDCFKFVTKLFINDSNEDFFTIINKAKMLKILIIQCNKKYLFSSVLLFFLKLNIDNLRLNLKGYYFTTDEEKIEINCKNLVIEIEIPHDMVILTIFQNMGKLETVKIINKNFWHQTKDNDLYFGKNLFKIIFEQPVDSLPINFTCKIFSDKLLYLSFSRNIYFLNPQKSFKKDLFNLAQISRI